MLIHCVFEFLGAKAFRTTTACIYDLTAGVDEIEAFGPGGVSDHDGIVHVVDVGMNAVFHGGFTFSGNFSTFFEGGGIVYARIFEFPAIFGMGFADVDDKELYLVVICFIQIAEADRLTDKRWSCEAAENECNGFF
jgi:hypothetical protein